MVYHLNCSGIYKHISAIETSQLNRQKCLDSLGVPNKHIFGGIYTDSSIYSLLTSQGFDIDRIIWVYSFYSDIVPAKPSLSVEDFEKQLDDMTYIKMTKDNVIDYVSSDKSVKYTVQLEDGCVFCVSTYVFSSLMEKSYYTDCKQWTEYYSQNELILRRFYNRDGTVALEELLSENKSNEKSLYQIAGKMLMNWTDFLQDFLSGLNLDRNDIIFTDRVPIYSLFTNKLYDITNVYHVFHSMHHYVTDTTETFADLGVYAALFRSRHRCGFITATKAQAEDVKKHVKMLWGDDFANVYAIPVGCVDELRYSSSRKKNSFIAVGRFVTSKRFDTVIRAIAIARQQIPDISLDIYGIGTLQPYFTNLINKLNCGDCIKLCGFADMTDTYKQYDAFVAATLCEGSSLAFLEALASGDPIISFDTPYSGVEFVKDGVNGYAVHLDVGTDEFKRAELLAEAIVRYCNLSDDKKMRMRMAAYDHASKYTFDEVANKWNQFLKTVLQ